MSFTNRLLLVVPGFGQPIQNDALFLLQGTALSTTAAQATNMAGLTPALKDGWIRVKIYNGGGTTPAIVSVFVQVTDGTTFVDVGTFSPQAALTLGTTGSSPAYGHTGAGGAGGNVGGVDLLFPFLTDLAITQVTIITTLSGTSPTASMDVEIGATN